MAINFPSSPTLNQTFASGETTYKYNGASWESIFVTSNVDLADAVAIAAAAADNAATSAAQASAAQSYGNLILMGY